MLVTARMVGTSFSFFLLSKILQWKYKALLSLSKQHVPQLMMEQKLETEFEPRFEIGLERSNNCWSISPPYPDPQCLFYHWWILPPSTLLPREKKPFKQTRKPGWGIEGEIPGKKKSYYVRPTSVWASHRTLCPTKQDIRYCDGLDSSFMFFGPCSRAIEPFKMWRRKIGSIQSFRGSWRGEEKKEELWELGGERKGAKAKENTAFLCALHLTGKDQKDQRFFSIFFPQESTIKHGSGTG